MPASPAAAPELRLAELMTAASLATDIGVGQPFEAAQRAALLAVGLARAAALPEREAQDAYYLALLKTIGCTGDEDFGARTLGEDAHWAGHMGGAGPLEMLGAMVRNVGRGAPTLARVQKVLGALAKLPVLAGNVSIHCEIAHLLAARLGLGASVVNGLGQVFENWDGSGLPRKLRGDAVARPVRVAKIVTDAECALRLFGTDDAVALVRRRAGRGYDPHLAHLFCREAAGLFGALEVPSVSAAVLAAEPGIPERLSGERLETAIRALGEFADMKSRYTRGHSAGVAALAAEAAGRAGLAPADVAAVRRAGHLHDVGRAGVFLRIWDKEGPLTDAEWERVRMHSYYTERILGRLPGLGDAPAIAALAHERLDGGGYHRRLPAAAVPFGARLLAAADAYHAMTEPRPHRTALPAARAADELLAEARAGRLDGTAVDAVLAAAGHAGRRARQERPAGLSEREVEVLRLLARGLTNKEIAGSLGISVKTAGHHVQHIFGKVGVSTRAAAGLFAMQNDLLEGPAPARPG